MNNKMTKISTGLILTAGLIATPAASANTGAKHATTPTIIAKGIITAPACNNIKSNYPNPGFTMQKAEVFTGTQYTTLKMTFNKNISMNILKNSKYYKDGASAYINLESTLPNNQWGTLFYDIRSNKATVNTMGSNRPDQNIMDKVVYSNVTFDKNIMRITFPRYPLNITNKTQYDVNMTYDYYAGEPNGVVTPYYTTECKTNKYPY